MLPVFSPPAEKIPNEEFRIPDQTRRENIILGDFRLVWSDFGLKAHGSRHGPKAVLARARQEVQRFANHQSANL